MGRYNAEIVIRTERGLWIPENHEPPIHVSTIDIIDSSQVNPTVIVLNTPTGFIATCVLYRGGQARLIYGHSEFSSDYVGEIVISKIKDREEIFEEAVELS